jgi:ADP-dependent NAD(P)H-hydrate dehydratase / NAD(P)H-hydrate epimerase
MLYQLSYRGSAGPGAYSTIFGLEKREMPAPGKVAGCVRSAASATMTRMIDIARSPELLTPSEMREADRYAVAAGTPSLDLMERAGRAVADEAMRWARSAGRITVLCGPGANGGDGFVAARLLAERGYRVEVGMLGKREALRGDAADAARRYSSASVPALDCDLEKSDLIVDALYGAGLDRDLTGDARMLVERVKAARRPGRRPVVAVDLPSGLDGGTGRVRGGAVAADASVTFFRLKPGHLLLPGRELCGRLVLADIGIPPAALGAISPQAFANAPVLWAKAMPRLAVAGHKYSRGHAVVVSGAAAHTGAARLAARAALRAGAGLVTLASPPDALAINASQLTAVMVASFEGAAGLAALLADPRRNAVALGPGAGVGPKTEALVWAALAKPTRGGPRRRAVLDADALTSFAGRAEALAALVRAEDADVVLTPHEGEFSRLFSGQTEILEGVSKVERARRAAGFLSAVVVLKGADTVVAAPDGLAAIGYDLPPTLATAGSGDVLAGLITGLLAQGAPIFEAASAGVWLHGAAARAHGAGLIAEDLPEVLPRVFDELAAANGQTTSK